MVTTGEKQRVAAFLLSYAGYVILMNTVDGPWRRWSKGAILDWWTLTHVGWGWLAKKFGLPFQTTMGLTIVNEAGEALVRRYRPDLTWGTPEGLLNIGVDVVSTGVGWNLG